MGDDSRSLSTIRASVQIHRASSGPGAPRSQAEYGAAGFSSCWTCTLGWGRVGPWVTLRTASGRLWGTLVDRALAGRHTLADALDRSRRARAPQHSIVS